MNESKVGELHAKCVKLGRSEVQQFLIINDHDIFVTSNCHFRYFAAAASFCNYVTS